MKETRRSNAFQGSCLVALLYLAGSLTAPASTPTVTTYKTDAQGGAMTYTFSASDFEPGTIEQFGDRQLNKLTQPLQAPGIWGGSADFVINELAYDIDPIVYNNILIHNNSGMAQSYVVTVSLPSFLAGPTQIRGSIDTSLIGTSAQVNTTSPFSIYTALIDGTSVATLQDDWFVLTTPQAAVSSTASFGWDLPYAAVNNNIGIELRFTLSPFDTVTIISDFEVVDVIPEPSAFALLGLGLGTLVVARRRA